ncbi:Bifunctional protein FolD 2, partial [Choanephora cucurbitarum]
MTATIIDGKAIAQAVRNEVKEKIASIKDKYSHFNPHLAMIQVGAREDSSIYVKMKDKAAKETGISITMEKLPESISQSELLRKVKQLNNDYRIHGILVQMPLPSHIDEAAVIEAIDYQKDVDGFHAVNIGNMAKKNSQPMFLPCTPKGIIHLLKSTGIEIAGKQAAVIGRSDIVGAPVATLLTAEHATVTLCHSKTPDVESI